MSTKIENIRHFIESIGCCIGVLYVISLAGTFILLIILTAIIMNYYYYKYHGVHETNFTFTGNYLIKTHYDDDQIYYSSDCQSTTPFGECYYNCYESSIYQYAENYAIDYCVFGVVLDGFIINEDDECVTSNPNRGIHDEMLVYKILWTYMSVNVFIIICMCVASRVYNKFEELKHEEESNMI